MTDKLGEYTVRGGNEARVLWGDHTYLIGVYFVEDFNGYKNPYAIRWNIDGIYRADGMESALDLIGIEKETVYE